MAESSSKEEPHKQWILDRYLKSIRRYVRVSDAILGLKQADHLTNEEFVRLDKSDASLRIGLVVATIRNKGTPESVFKAFLDSLRDDEGQLEMGHSHIVNFLQDKYDGVKNLRTRRGESRGDPTLATHEEYKRVEKESGRRPHSSPSPTLMEEETLKSIKENFLTWLKDIFKTEMDRNESFFARLKCTLKEEVCATIQDCLGPVLSSVGLSIARKVEMKDMKERPADSPQSHESHATASPHHLVRERGGKKKICQTRDEIKMQQGYDGTMQQLARMSHSDPQLDSTISEDVSEGSPERTARSYCMQGFSVTSAEMLGDVLGRKLVLDASQCHVGRELRKDELSRVHVGHFGAQEVAVKTRCSGPLSLSVKEAFILSQLQSPNIVPLVGVLWKENPAAVQLVIESPSSTLEEYLSDVSTPDHKQQAQIALHLCQGLAKLMKSSQGMGIVHNDVSCCNCFIRSKNGSHMTAALGGFSLAEIAKDDGTCVAQKVQPPYQHDYNAVKYSSHGSDIRAFALVLHSLYGGRSSVRTRSSAAPIAGCPARPPHMPELLYEVVKECCRSNPTTRPSAVDLLPRLRSLHMQGQ